MKENPINVPNAITGGRILASVGLFVFIAVSGITVSVPLALVTAGVGMTDFLDGYLARKNKQVTSLGKILDPIADKVYNWGLAFTLMSMGAMPLWPALIALRDVTVAGTYYHLKANKNVEDLKPTLPAKAKMAFQSLGLVSSLAFGFGTTGASLIAPIAMGAAIATGIPDALIIKKKYFPKKEKAEEYPVRSFNYETEEKIQEKTTTLSYPRKYTTELNKEKVKKKSL